MIDKNNEVLFGEYCKTCKYERYSETDNPCAECLAEPVNLYSHKPVKWEGADGIYAGPPPRPDHAYQRAVKYVPENRKGREKAIARQNIDAEYTGNKVQIIDDKVTDDQYPSATAVKKALEGANEVTAQSLAKKIDAPDTCECGEFLAVEEVNEDGVVTKVKGAKVQTDPPDWNENDPTKPGYVKNRPGGYATHETKTVEILWEGLLEGFEQKFELGTKIQIKVNGQEYSLDVKQETEKGILYIGDNLWGGETEMGWCALEMETDVVHFIVNRAPSVDPTEPEPYIVEYSAIVTHTIDSKYISPILILDKDSRTINNPKVQLPLKFYTLGITLEYDEESGVYYYADKDYRFIKRLFVSSTYFTLNPTLNKTLRYLFKANEYDFPNSDAIRMTNQSLLICFTNNKSGNERIDYTTCLNSISENYNKELLQRTYILRGELITNDSYKYTIILTIKQKQDEKITKNNWELLVTRVE